jgi:hypothetical protein
LAVFTLESTFHRHLQVNLKSRYRCPLENRSNSTVWLVETIMTKGFIPLVSLVCLLSACGSSPGTSVSGMRVALSATSATVKAGGTPSGPITVSVTRSPGDTHYITCYLQNRDGTTVASGIRASWTPDNRFPNSSDSASLTVQVDKGFPVGPAPLRMYCFTKGPEATANFDLNVQ